MTIRVTHFMRDRRRNAFSMERLYEDVRKGLPSDCEAFEWVCRNPSKGFWPRLRDAWVARKSQGDVNHVTGDTHYLTYFLDRRRTVLTVHDLVTLERLVGPKRALLWFFWFWLPVMRSRIVITVSDSTRKALLHTVRCSPDKVVAIHNPVSAEFQPNAKSFNAKCPRILQVGTKTNKNIPRVAAALAGIPCKLVVIGPLSPDQVETIVRYGVDYENHTELSREDLLNQYIQSDLLIFVSTYEGFGLPIVEANAVGRPVVASDIAPMTEVAGDAALLVDPFNVQSIRQGVVSLVEDANLRDRLVSAGLQNARRFASQGIAERYASVYRGIAT